MIPEGKDELDSFVNEAAKLRGHLCLGIPLGVKMGMQGLHLLHMEDKNSRDNLMVIVENNKCPVDGIQVVTGCSAGSRRLKVFDYGKSAAVFYDGATGIGYRVTTKPDFLTRAIELAVKDGMVKEGQNVEEFSQLERKVMKNAFTKMTQDELLEYHEVSVSGNTPLLPNLTLRRSICSKCGEEIMDGKGIKENDKTICDSCLHGSYYIPL